MKEKRPSYLAATINQSSSRLAGTTRVVVYMCEYVCVLVNFPRAHFPDARACVIQDARHASDHTAAYHNSRRR